MLLAASPICGLLHLAAARRADVGAPRASDSSSRARHDDISTHVVVVVVTGGGWHQQQQQWNKSESLLRRGDARLPSGWDPAHGVQRPAVTSLGVVLGASPEVAAHWDKKTGRAVEDKFGEWCSKRVPTTSNGRNLVIRNSVLSKVWYLFYNQCPPGGYDARLLAWDKAQWSFFDSGNYGSRGRGPLASVKRGVLVQDYAEGGARCLDVETFARALLATWVVRRLPTTTMPYLTRTVHRKCVAANLRG